MSIQDILDQIRALWGPSGATVKGIARAAHVSHVSVRKVVRGGACSHSVAVAILAAVKALPGASGVSEEKEDGT